MQGSQRHHIRKQYGKPQSLARPDGQMIQNPFQFTQFVTYKKRIQIKSKLYIQNNQDLFYKQVKSEEADKQMKRCYYQILQVDKKAASGQIKTAYRKLALKYHPDKNPSEDSKKIFMQVQEAYDVLADPNERTFYDSNRQKILFNKEQMSKQDLQQYSFGFNIWPYFTAKCYKGFTDEPGCFFQVYRQVFQNIKAEQVKAFKSRDDLEEQMRKFEGFGVSNTSLEKVISFYEDWQNFTTYKTFSWSQEYDTRDASNRWVKRRMLQQNKKQRLKQKKTYIKTIKDLESFVKKRDPRFQQYLLHLKQQQELKQKQKVKKQQDKKKQKQDMKNIKQTLQQQRFRQIQEYYKQNNAPQNGSKGTLYEDYNDDCQAPEFYCPICQKTFKSQNQLENHQKSKMHKQNIKLIQKQVMLPKQIIQQARKQQNNGTLPAEQPKKKRNRKKKNKNNNSIEQSVNLSSDEQRDGQTGVPQKEVTKKQVKAQQKKQANKNNTKKKQQSDEQLQANQEEPTKNQPPKIKQPQKKKKLDSQNQSESSQQDILMSLAKNINKKAVNAPQQDQQNKEKKGKGKGKNKNLIKQQVKTLVKNTKPLDEDLDQEQGQEKKLGKAKLKKLKKAEQQKQSNMKCKTCGVIFPSKSKLFDHIKQSGHAATKH